MTTITNKTATTVRKATENEMYTMMLGFAEVQANADLVDFINKKIDQNKQKSAHKTAKQTAKQVEDNAIMERIVEFLSDNKGTGYNADELIAELGVDRTQRQMVYLVADLVRDGAVERHTIKGKVFYSIANED